MSISRRQRARSLFGIVLPSLALVACTHTSKVTPWLRTTEYRPLRIDSGGPQSWAMTERKVGDRWVKVSDQGMAMPLAGGRLAVYTADKGLVLADATRALATLPCSPGRLRSTPDGSALVCLEFESWHSRPTEAAT